MMPPIFVSERADNDLLEIWQHVALDSPAAADRLLDRIESRWQQLAENPGSGMARNDIAPGLRHLVTGPYLIFYRMASGRIEIVRILHGSRKIGEADLA